MLKYRPEFKWAIFGQRLLFGFFFSLLCFHCHIITLTFFKQGQYYLPKTFPKVSLLLSHSLPSKDHESILCFRGGGNKIQEKFIEMSRVGICNSGNPRVLTGR